MAEGSSGEKKHPATDRRRRQAREKGQVVRSQDLTSAALLLAALGVLSWFGGAASEQIASAMKRALSTPQIESPGTEGATHELLRIGGQLAFAAAPILIAMMVAAILVNVTQTGLILTPSKLIPKFSHVSPLSGIKRILSLPGLMRLAFGLFKVAVIIAVTYASVTSGEELLLSLADMSIPQLAKAMFTSLIKTCLWIGVALFVLALFEYAFQRWKHENDLMMTDQEIRDELKETEGDPQVAARRRQVQRQLAMNRVASDVPKADVVVSNPTELAIAIRYDPLTMPAPVVLAKGAGLVAQRIRRVALEHGIPVVERKPLAQILYKTVDVGEVVPPDHYQAVAEVLRYVYQLQGKEIPRAA